MVIHEVVSFLFFYLGQLTLGHELLLQGLEHDEEHRHDKEQGYRTDEHTAHGTHADRDVAVGPYARMGNIPNIMVSEVIRIGRNRT